MSKSITFKEVPPEMLRWTCDPDSLGFENTGECQQIKGIIGQERALTAIRMGLEIIIVLVPAEKALRLEYAHHIACPDAEEEHAFIGEHRGEFPVCNLEDGLALGQEHRFHGHGGFAVFQCEGVRVKGVEHAITLLFEGGA